MRFGFIGRLTRRLRGTHKVGVLLTCSDGRLFQDSVWQRLWRFARNLLDVDYVDVVAVPGPDGCSKVARNGEQEAVVGWSQLLAKLHNAKGAIVLAHERCAGNAVDDAQHRADALSTAQLLRSKMPEFSYPIYAAVAIYVSDKKWKPVFVGQA